MLRGIAVLMVIIHHDWIENAYFLRSGVDLFFVLSGFLISGLLFSEFQKSGEIRVGRFLVRRAFKIYPAFYFLFFFSTIGFFVLSHGHLPATNKVIGEATFTQNYVDSLWGYTWSLAVEEHFYLFLPLLLLAMSRIWPQTRFRSLPVISLIFSIVCLSLRLATHPHGVFEWQGLYMTQTRIDGLFAGVTLSYLFHFERERFELLKAPAFRVLGAGVLLVMIALNTLLATASLAYIGFACILPWFLSREPSRNAIVRTIAHIGTYSYSIYLWQGPVKGFVCSVLLEIFHIKSGSILYAAAIPLSVAAGIAAAKLVELPALRIRDRFFSRESARAQDVFQLVRSV